MYIVTNKNVKQIKYIYVLTSIPYEALHTFCIFANSFMRELQESFLKIHKSTELLTASVNFKMKTT